MSAIRPLFIALSFSGFLMSPASAKPLPDPMVSNLFALTDVAASLSICAKSSAFSALRESERKTVRRLSRTIDKLVAEIAQTYDPALVKFYEAQRNELSQDPDKQSEMKIRYGFCGKGMIGQMHRYVYTSKKTLDEFFRAYNR
jgi:hypothetical protein